MSDLKEWIEIASLKVKNHATDGNDEVTVLQKGSQHLLTINLSDAVSTYRIGRAFARKLAARLEAEPGA